MRIAQVMELFYLFFYFYIVWTDDASALHLSKVLLRVFCVNDEQSDDDHALGVTKILLPFYDGNCYTLQV